MDGLNMQSLTTCDELYRALKLHDRENIMYRITEDDFTIKLDEHHKINGYDSKGEVYLEIGMQEKQIMHWQLDYSEAYADLTEILESPEARMERVIEAQTCKKKSDGCLVFGICWLVFTFVLLFILAELEESTENINRPLACILCLAVPILMAAFAVGFVHSFHKKDQKENI